MAHSSGVGTARQGARRLSWRRAAALKRQIGQAIRGFAARHFGEATLESCERVRFTVLDAPYEAVRSSVQAARPPSVQADAQLSG